MFGLRSSQRGETCTEIHTVVKVSLHWTKLLQMMVMMMMMCV